MSDERPLIQLVLHARSGEDPGIVAELELNDGFAYMHHSVRAELAALDEWATATGKLLGAEAEEKLRSAIHGCIEDMGRSARQHIAHGRQMRDAFEAMRAGIGGEFPLLEREAVE